MALTKDEKAFYANEYGKHEGDTGSAEVQIAMLTKRIKDLTEHLRANKKMKLPAAVCSRWSAAAAV